MKPEKVTIGNPMEFFREMELIFGDMALTITPASKSPELKPTGIDGVAKFDGELFTDSEREIISRLRSPGFGAFLIALGFIGTFYLLFVNGFGSFFSVLLMIAFLSMIVIGAYGFTSIQSQYSGNLFLKIWGEAYQAKAVADKGEKISVLSRATLQTGCSFDQGTSQNLQQKLNDHLERLDSAIQIILPKFLLEKTELPDTKS